MDNFHTFHPTPYPINTHLNGRELFVDSSEEEDDGFVLVYDDIWRRAGREKRAGDDADLLKQLNQAYRESQCPPKKTLKRDYTHVPSLNESENSPKKRKVDNWTPSNQENIKNVARDMLQKSTPSLPWIPKPLEQDAIPSRKVVEDEESDDIFVYYDDIWRQTSRYAFACMVKKGETIGDGEIHKRLFRININYFTKQLVDEGRPLRQKDLAFITKISVPKDIKDPNTRLFITNVRNYINDRFETGHIFQEGWLGEIIRELESEEKPCAAVGSEEQDHSTEELQSLNASSSSDSSIQKAFIGEEKDFSLNENEPESSHESESADIEKELPAQEESEQQTFPATQKESSEVFEIEF